MGCTLIVFVVYFSYRLIEGFPQKPKHVEVGGVPGK